MISLRSRIRWGRGWTAYDLQLHGLAIELNGPDFLCHESASILSSPQRKTDAYKVDTDCGNVGLGVGVIGKSQEQARLSNTGVTDEEQLEEVIVSAQVVNSLFQAHKKSGFSGSCRWRGCFREMLYKSVSTIQAFGVRRLCVG